MLNSILIYSKNTRTKANWEQDETTDQNKLGSDILILAPYITAFLQVQIIAMALSSSQLGNKQSSLIAQNQITK